jgi:tetratricopeptide (TPR) repeat protein
MTPASITQWLQQAGGQPDSAEISALKEQYPYFIPLHYMTAAAAQKEYRELVLHGAPDLYCGNWLLFHQLIKPANSRPVAAAETTIITPPEELLPVVAQEAEVHSAPIVEAEPLPAVAELTVQTEETQPLIQPIFMEDYFLHQGIPIEDKLPQVPDIAQQEEAPVVPKEKEDPKSLMVVMSFTEWLMHFKTKTQQEKEEDDDRRAVKHMWQKEKLAAALEEEDDEIPENVFEMAVNSITKEDGLASESLAEILVKQGKWDKAIEMYRKLSLRNPQKSAYFAQQIASIQKKSQ